MLLLYHTSMSCKSPREWYEFDYKTQVIPSGFPLRTRGVEGSGGACWGCSETCPRVWVPLKDGVGAAVLWAIKGL